MCYTSRRYRDYWYYCIYYQLWW